MSNALDKKIHKIAVELRDELEASYEQGFSDGISGEKHEL